MNIAMGMVAAMVKAPHALWARALTTAMASPPSAQTMMKRVATAVVTPATPVTYFVGDVVERQAVVAHRGDEDDEVVHRPGRGTRR